MSSIEPTFTPGSGWYKMGAWAPGSIADIAAKKTAAYVCTVIRMREFAMRMPIKKLMEREHPRGGLICVDHYTWPKWHADLHTWPDMVHVTHQLSNLDLVKERDGIKQFSGTEWHAESRQHFQQTWLCVPTLEVGMAILQRMQDRSSM